MHFPGPDNADLANVHALNRAFIAWQRVRPQEATDPVPVALTRR